MRGITRDEEHHDLRERRRRRRRRAERYCRDHRAGQCAGRDEHDAGGAHARDLAQQIKRDAGGSRARSREGEKAAPAAQESEAAPAAEDAASPDSGTTGETQEADPVQGEPPLELPRSWSRERSDAWAKLDRDTQQYLLDHDRDASATVRKAQNEAAEKLKGLTAKEQAAEQARQQYEQRTAATAAHPAKPAGGRIRRHQDHRRCRAPRARRLAAVPAMGPAPRRRSQRSQQETLRRSSAVARQRSGNSRSLPGRRTISSPSASPTWPIRPRPRSCRRRPSPCSRTWASTKRS